MIINNASQPRKNRLLGFLAGATLCGWAGFVLTGATAAVPAAETPPADAHAQPPMLWRLMSDAQQGDAGHLSERFLRVAGMPAEGAWLGGADNLQMFVFSPDAGADGEHTIEMTCVATATNFDGFESAHPGADANGDGTVSKPEHDAYMIALAMHAPAGVLQRYPHADRNQDGTLDALEAAWLVVSPPSMPRIALAGSAAGEAPAIEAAGMPLMLKMRVDASGEGAVVAEPGDAAQPRVIRLMKKLTNENGVVTEETQEGDNPPQIRVLRASGAEGAPVEVKIEADGAFRARATGTAECSVAGEQIVIAHRDGANVVAPRIAIGSFHAELPEPPVVWLLQNVSATPTTAEVGRFVSIAESMPLAIFLEQNPKADRNNDGKLTVEERDEYVEKHQTAARTRILEKHPEADANGDGILSNDEMKTFFRSRIPGEAGAVSAKWVGSDGSEAPISAERRIMIRRTDTGETTRAIEIEVQAGDAGPK